MIKNWEEKIKNENDKCLSSEFGQYVLGAWVWFLSIEEKGPLGRQEETVQILMAQLSHLYPIELTAMDSFPSCKDSFYVIHFTRFGDSHSVKLVSPPGENMYFIRAVTFSTSRDHDLILS